MRYVVDISLRARDQVSDVLQRVNDSIMDMGSASRTSKSDLDSFNDSMGRSNSEALRVDQSINRLNSQFQGLQIGLVVKYAQALVSTLVALGGELVAVAASAAAAGGALAGMAAAAGAQAVPVLGLFAAAMVRLTSVFDAVKQRQQVQQASGQQLKQSMDAQRAATERIRGAQEGLSNAHRAVADAQHAVLEAQEGVTQANERATLASQSLTEARKAARRELEDMIIAEKRARLAAEDAESNVGDAQEALRRAESGGTSQEIGEAQRKLEEQRLERQENSLRSKRLTADTRSRRAGGVEQMPGVVSAQRALKQANEGIADSERRLMLAHRGVGDAQRNVANASRALASARRSATDATQNQTAAQQQLTNALKDMSGAERALYRTITRMGDFMRDPKNPLRKATDNIVESFDFAFRKVEGLLNNRRLMGAAQGLTEVMGQQMNRMTNTITGPRAVDFGVDMMREAKTNLVPLTTAFQHLFSIFMAIARAASPMLRRLIADFADWTKKIDNSVSSGKGLEKFFKTGEESLRAWLKLIGAFGSLMGAIFFPAAKQGNEDMTDLADTINGWADDLRNDQAGVANFFKKVSDGAKDIGRVIAALAVEMNNTFSTEALDSFADMLINVFIPALGNTIKAMGTITTIMHQFLGLPVIRDLAQWFVTMALLSRGFLAMAGVIRFLATPLAAMLVGFRLLTGAIGKTSAEVGLVGGRFVAYTAAAAGIIAVLAILYRRSEAFRDVLGFLKDHIGLLIPLLVLFRTRLLAFGMMVNILGPLPKIIGAIAAAFRTLAGGAGIGAAITALKDYIARSRGMGRTVPVPPGRDTGRQGGRTVILPGGSSTGRRRQEPDDDDDGRSQRRDSRGRRVARGIGVAGLIGGGLALSERGQQTLRQTAGLGRGGRAMAQLQGTLDNLINPSISGLLAGFNKKIDDLSTFSRNATGNFRRLVATRNVEGLRDLARQGRDLASAYPKQADGLNRIANSADKAAAQLAKMAGVQNRLRRQGIPLNTELDKLTSSMRIGGARAQRVMNNLEQGFQNLAKNGVSSIAELRDGMGRNINIIDLLFRRGSRNWREAMSINTAKGIKAVGTSMADGRLSVREGTREILRLTRRNFGASAESTRRNFEAARKQIVTNMDLGVVSVQDGTKLIRDLLTRELKAMGLSEKDIKGLEKAGLPRRSQPGQIRDFGNIVPPQAHGGWVGNKGERGKDNQLRRLGRGEAVLNWAHQKMVDPALAWAKRTGFPGYGSLDEMFNGVRAYHAGGPEQPGYAKGGYVQGAVAPRGAAIRKLNQMLFDRGFNVTSGYRSTSTTFHGSGDASDYGDSRNNMSRLWAVLHPMRQQLAELYGPSSLKKPTLNKFGRGFQDGELQGTHEDHVHVAVLSGIRGRLRRIINAAGGAAEKLMAPFKNIPRLRIRGRGMWATLAQRGLDVARQGANRRGREMAESAGSSGGTSGGDSGGGIGNVAGQGATLMRRISRQKGWNFRDWWEIDRRESGHGTNLVNPTSTARLRGQFLDMNWGKYGIGSDPRRSPSMRQQIISMARYIGSRYGNPTKALAQHNARNWYAHGGEIPGREGSAQNILAHAGEWVLNRVQQKKLAEMIAISSRTLKGQLFTPLRQGRVITPIAGSTAGATAGTGGGIADQLAAPTRRGIDNLKHHRDREMRQVGKDLDEFLDNFRATLKRLDIRKLKKLDSVKELKKALEELGVEIPKKLDTLKELRGALGKMRVKPDKNLDKMDRLFKRVDEQVKKWRESLETQLLRVRVEITKAGVAIRRLDPVQSLRANIGLLQSSYNGLAGERSGIQRGIRLMERQIRRSTGATRRRYQRSLRGLRNSLVNVEDAMREQAEALRAAQEEYYEAIISSINDTAGRRLSMNDLQQRVLGIGGLTNFGAQGNLLEQRGQIMADQRAQLAWQMGHAQTLGDSRRVEELTLAITELDVSMMENREAVTANTRAAQEYAISQIVGRTSFITGVFSGLNSIVTAAGELSGLIDIAQQIEMAEGARVHLSQGGGELAGRLFSGYGVDVRGLHGAAFANALTNAYLPGIANSLSDSDRVIFENLINSIIANEQAVQDNSTLLAELNGLTRVQSFSSAMWTLFREAVFTGTGGLLPQYSIPGLGTGGATPTPVIGGMPGRVDSTGGGVHVTVNEAGGETDYQYLGDRLAYEMGVRS